MKAQIKKGDMVLVRENCDHAFEPEYGIVLKCYGRGPGAACFAQRYVVHFSDGRRMLVWTDEIIEVVK